MILAFGKIELNYFDFLLLTRRLSKHLFNFPLAVLIYVRVLLLCAELAFGVFELNVDKH